MLSFLLGGVEEAGSSWRAGLAAGVLAWLLPALRKRKSSVPGLWRVQERSGDKLEKVPTKTVGKVEVFPAQAGMSPPQCLNESPSKRKGNR